MQVSFPEHQLSAPAATDCCTLWKCCNYCLRSLFFVKNESPVGPWDTRNSQTHSLIWANNAQVSFPKHQLSAPATTDCCTLLKVIVADLKKCFCIIFLFLNFSKNLFDKNWTMVKLFHSLCWATLWFGDFSMIKKLLI